MMKCSLQSSVGWILDNSQAFVVLSFSWMFIFFPLTYALTPAFPCVSSRLGMIYWMDPTLSPLIKPVSLQGSRLRSSLDPMWSTSTSPDSWSKLFLSKRCFTTNVHNNFVWCAVLVNLKFAAAHIQWFSLASVQGITSVISFSGKLRGDVSCYNLFSDMQAVGQEWPHM